MKKWLVDVPVKINIWIRPECQRRQFEIIRRARPSVLFVTSDGGRNEHEWSRIFENRRIYDEEIDWECTVYKLYMDHNYGLYEMAKRREELIWSKVDRCVFLEDDQLPSLSFFRYCAELLEKYKDDERIECICGFNQLGVYDRASSDYFFSKQGSIWGIASWKRVWEERGNYDYFSDEYLMSLLKEETKHNSKMWVQLCTYGRGDKFMGHVAGSEFWIQFNMYGQHRLQIIPKRNMISNIGYGGSATHSNDKLEEMSPWKRRLFNSPIYELSFPMKHPAYVIPDQLFERERNKMMNKDYKWGEIRDKLYRLYYRLRHFDIKWTKKRIASIFSRRTIEDER